MNQIKVVNHTGEFYIGTNDKITIDDFEQIVDGLLSADVRYIEAEKMDGSLIFLAGKLLKESMFEFVEV